MLIVIDISLLCAISNLLCLNVVADFTIFFVYLRCGALVAWLEFLELRSWVL
jgi:hypothetical protein